MATHHIFILIPILLSFCATELLAAWDGITKQQPSSITIDGRQYYSIETPEELAWFAQKVNSGDTAISAILSADIDLSMKDWTPIVKYDGIFDGNGHTISGLYVSGKKYAGLFGSVDVGVIKNLVLDNSSINGFCESTSDNYCDSYTGGIAGVGSNATFQNIVNRANITGPQSAKKIYRNSYIGGILGAATSYYKLIDNCSNEGSVIASTNDTSSYVGGILGSAKSSSFSITNSSNYGTVSGGGYTGGIAGEISNINNVINKGLISGNHYVGGIAGSLGIVYDSKQLVNEGDIQIENAKDTLYIGGIAGLYGAGYNGSANMKNTGKIYAVSNSTIYAGGLAGKVSNTSTIKWSFNVGDIEINSEKETAYAGGLIGTLNGSVKIKNVYNRGNIKSSHYAAGIVPRTQQNTAASYYSNYIDNFYVASNSIDAPNAAAFINYNSVTATVKNGFCDATKLPDLPLIGTNLGEIYDLSYKTTIELQTDSMAYLLDTCNHDYNSNEHWSREYGYPMFMDSSHSAIYKIAFIWHNPNYCSMLCQCNQNISYHYTNYKSLVDPFPQSKDISKWLVPSRNQVVHGNQPVFNNYVFNWFDTLVVATYQECDDYASTDIGCCLSYMLDFQKEYASMMNQYYNQDFLSRDSIDLSYCLDDNKNGTLNWNDPSSQLSNVYQSMVNLIESVKPYINPNPDALVTNNIPIFYITVEGHGIQITNAKIGSAYAVFDMQGRVLKKGRVQSANFNIPVNMAGNYLVWVGNRTQQIIIK